MNIREIEQQLGIPRANVRYYEKEGLLHPERSANNYRVYTDADVETLKKIRLLRQLDMPVETIRAVQAGEVELADALVRQERLLENESVKLERARVVCRSMLEDGATYPALGPARYEGSSAALPGRTAETPEVKRPPVEGAEWAFDPWQRYWARTFDVGLTYSIVGVVMALVFHTSAVNTNVTLLRFVLCLLGWGLELVLEPLLLCTWGTTPGKWLLGLELRDERGGKLRYSQGLERTWRVLWTGYGLEIPVFSLYRMYRCYKECRENRPLSYDDDEGFLYYSKTPDTWMWRAFVSVGLSLLLIPVQVWCAAQAVVPPNRGEITAAEYAENVNRLSRDLDAGLWVNEEGFELSDQTISISENGGPWEDRQYGKPYGDAPFYTVETDAHGHVTAVCVQREGRDAGENMGWVWLPSGNRLQTIMGAFLGTELDGWRTLNSPFLKLDWTLWTGEPIQDGPFTLTLRVEMEGYWAAETFSILIPKDGVEECWYRFSLRLEKTE